MAAADSQISPENRVLEAEAPAIWRSLSALGRRVAFPPDIPFQAAQARGKAYNATIGQITDGRGGAVPLPSIDRALAGLEPAARHRALLYSPVEGIAEVRRLWRRRQRRGQPDERPSTLPAVTVGLTHGLSVVADLFGGEGRRVVVPEPFWGNYRQTFATRTGARMVPVAAWRDGAFDPRAIARALAGLPAEEPAVAILNHPSNPGGYSPTVAERREVVDSLVEAADRRPLIVVCDDAYAGLVFEEEIPRGSLFWELVGRHPNLVPVKIDGATKELSLFGGRVGFVTFALDPESAAAGAIESKVKCLVRAALGSPVATTQMVLLEALASDRVDEEIEAVRRRLEGRYRVLQRALTAVDRAHLSPLPFNSGCFALVELSDAGPGAADRLRRHLLDRHDTGLVSVGDRRLRIAFCSVERASLPELVRRLERGAAELAAAG